MTKQVTDREILAELAARPIGSPELEAEANSVAHIAQNGGRPAISSDLRETIARTHKKWLPAGKKPTRGPAVQEAEAAFYARQIDLEDAVEAAGGARGSATHA